jgi:tetratricopeptide (TPR) repeat protein
MEMRGNAQSRCIGLLWEEVTLVQVRTDGRSSTLRAATHIAVAVCLACLCQLIGAARADTSREERLDLLAAETDSLLEAGAYERLLQLAERGLALAESTLDAPAPERTDWLLSVGWAHYKLGHLELAERLVREGLAAEMARDSAASVTHLRGHRYLRTLYVRRDSYEESEALAERCVELSQAVYGADDVETAGDLLVLARLRIYRDRIGEAQDLIDRAEALVRDQLGDEDEFLADVLLVRSLLVDSLGKYDASLDYLERSLEIKERYRGARHPELVPTLGLLADLLLNRGELVEAEALLRRALSIQEAATGCPSRRPRPVVTISRPPLSPTRWAWC